MPYVTESRYAELLRLENAVSDIEPHIEPWIGMLEAHVASLACDDIGQTDSAGSAELCIAEKELFAMKQNLGALFPAVALAKIMKMRADRASAEVN